MICKMDHCTILQKRQFLRTKKCRLNPVLHLVISKMDHCTILQKRYFLMTKTKPSVFPSQRLHLVIGKIDCCTILFLTTKNTKTKSSVCIWWFVKWITAPFYKKDNFSQWKLNPVSLLRSVCICCLVKLIAAQFYKKRQFLTTKNMTTKSSICIWRLVKLITARFYKKDNFSRWRNTTTKLTKTCVKPVFLSCTDRFRCPKSAFSTVNFSLSTGTSPFLRRNTYRSYAGRLYRGLYVSQQ